MNKLVINVQIVYLIWFGLDKFKRKDKNILHISILYLLKNIT